MKIKIYQNHMNENYTIYMNDRRKNLLMVNTKPIKFNLDRFKFLVSDMVMDWPNELINDKEVCDGLEFKIVIKDNNNKEDVYIFKNKFPEDIFRLTSLINEVLEEMKWALYMINYLNLLLTSKKW